MGLIWLYIVFKGDYENGKRGYQQEEKESAEK